MVAEQSAEPDLDSDAVYASEALSDDGAEGSGSATGAAEARRERSRIEFPYGDLDDAVIVAKATYDLGGQQCSLDQLAAHLEHDSVSSGAFRVKVSTARTFGLVDVRSDTVSLTRMGRQIVDPSQERQVRTQAFLHVPLYREIYEKYKGYRLPNDIGLESEMMTLGVAVKQKGRARQVFQRSAEQAGMFPHGRDRLIMPTMNLNSARESDVPAVDAPPAEVLAPRPPRGVDRGDLPPGIHPMIQGLVNSIPPFGTRWPLKERRRWVRTAEEIFSYVYGESDD